MKARPSARFVPKMIVPIFFCLIALLVGNQVMTLANLQTVGDHQQRVVQSQMILSDVESIRTNLIDGETGVRGYLLVPEARHLDPYNNGMRDINHHYDELRDATSSNSETQSRMARLGTLIHTQVEILHTMISRAQKHDKGSDISATVDQGKDAMDEARALLDTISKGEQKELAERSAVAEKSLRTAEYSLNGGSAVSIIFIVFTYMLLRRQLYAQNKDSWRRKAQAELAMAVTEATTVEVFCSSVCQYLAKAVGAPMAAFFVRENGHLITKGGVALPASATSARFKIGEGLIGQAAAQQTTTVVRDGTRSSAPVMAGTETLQPIQLIVSPIVFAGETLGVLELSGLSPYADTDLELVESLRETIANGLQSALSRSKLQALLEETQSQSEELQAQQEELRSYTQQLEARAAALQMAQQEQLAQQEELTQNNEELEQQARALEQQQMLVNQRNVELEAAKKELEEKADLLGTASQYKSQFLANMSHELRTPLNSLLILASLLADNRAGRLSGDEVEYARTIYNSGNDLLLLINDILDLAKVESGNVELQIETVDIRSLLDSLQGTYQAVATDKKLEFQVLQNLESGATFQSDRLRLEQILRNFLSNSLKFTETGKVELSARSDQDWIVFEVRDTGIGIPSDKLEQIFGAFQQADGSTSRKYGGTGLGLTISRELAHLLGGRIEVESEDGKGSCFRLAVPRHCTLPQFQAAAAETAPPPPPPKLATPAVVAQAQAAELPEGEYLLIVEDDQAFGKALHMIAREAGYKAVWVHDGETALATVEARLPLGLLLDVKLPGIGGLAVLERIKSNPKTRHLPVHIISSMERTMNAMRMGAMGYLVKPASRQDLLTALERVSSVASGDLKRVLIIEDDPVQRNSLGRLLEDSKVLSESVGTGIEALERVKNSVYGCLILDLNLPDMSGFELLHRLETQISAPLPPVVVYTGKDLTRKEEEELRRYSESIIIKGARSPERLLEEVSLFLHQLDSELSPRQRDSMHASRISEQSFQGRRLLLADDDLRNTFALISALEPEGFSVVVARNGKQALAELENHPDLELVLMDIMMPEMDGIEAIGHIRANRKTRNLPIIALTAKAMKEDQERCLAAGANDYLTKPFKLDHLFSLLRVWLPARISPAGDVRGRPHG